MTEQHDTTAPADPEAGSQPRTTTSAYESAPSGSAMASIRERRKKRMQKLHFDIEVPGMEPPIFLRCKPVDQPTFMKQIERAGKSKDDDAIVRANAVVLADACIGVFELDDRGREVSVDPGNPTTNPSEWLTIGPELGKLIAEEDQLLSRATDVARALFDNDMALCYQTDRLITWSRTMQEDDDREHEGN